MNAIVTKSKAFAVSIVRLYKHLSDKNRDYVLPKQLLRSGAGIGANVREATQGQSKKDFASKRGIALKEAVETEYWLEILHETGYLKPKEFASIMPDCQELCRMLVAIVKTSKSK